MKNVKIKNTSFDKSWRQDFKKNKALYVVMLPAVIYFFVLHYIPMFGLLMAFEDFSVRKGIFGSTWIGLGNFIELFTGETFLLALRNTAVMAAMNLTIGFVMPIIFAFLISEIKGKVFKRTLQTMAYVPNFVAAVVVVQLLKEFVGQNGAITLLLTHLGFVQQNWLANAKIPVFWMINTFIVIWQTMGFNSIVYVAAIESVSHEIQEAAVIDGANKWKRITRITLPTIMPTVVMLFTIRIGLVFVMGFDKILLMYMPTTYVTADVLTTYTFRMAFASASPDYGLAAASGLFQSVIGTILLIISNKLSRKVTDRAVF